MTAEERERHDPARYRDKLVQKLEKYLRAHFDWKSAEMAREPAERLLWRVGAEWLLNRGIPRNDKVLKEAVKEAMERYLENWEGKEQGEDDRSGALGRQVGPSLKEYEA